MADSVSSISSSPYTANTYTAESNSYNTLTIESYFKLLASQLANQDMTNPMDNSEMMAQMVQMAMVQSLATINDDLKTQLNFSQGSSLTSMIGQKVTVAVENEDGTMTEKTGVISRVNLAGDEPTFRLEGDVNDYAVSNLQTAYGKSESDSSAGPGANL